MAPPPTVVLVAVLLVNVDAPFKVVVPVPVDRIPPPPPVVLLLANVDAPVMFKTPAFE
jgi:hypothetical protein